MPYTTPNGCVYDSGDYALPGRCAAAIDYEGIDAQRADAEARGKLVGVGIGSTLDSGTNNFGQSRLLNPELQFSRQQRGRLGQAGHLRGGRRHPPGRRRRARGTETTASQVVADVIGCSPDDVNVQARARQLLELARGLFRDRRQPVRRDRARRRPGRRRPARSPDAAKLAAVVLGTTPDNIVLEESTAKREDNPEAVLPFMALGAIVNANNAGLPPETEDITMNCRYVYRPPFEVPDVGSTAASR